MDTMRTRWLLTAILIFILAFALAACGAEEEEPAAEVVEEPAEEVEVVEEEVVVEEPAAATDSALAAIPVEEGATIIFSGWGDETEQQVYRDSIERFNAIFPGVTVDYQPIPADFQTKLKAAMAGGTAPDVFYVDDQLMTAFAPTGQLLALDPYMEQAGVTREEFLQPLIEIFTLDGNTYALPKDWGTLGLIYLPGAFEAAGVEPPTADWTWDDLRAAAEGLAEGGDIAPYCMGPDWARFAPFVFSQGGTFVSEDLSEAQLESETVMEAAEFVAAMKEEGLLVTPADVGASWCGEAIGKELAAMTLEGGWMVNFMNQNYPDVEWAAVPIPAGPQGEADIIFTNGIGVNAATPYPNAAAAFTLFLTGRENQAAIAETGFAYPTRPDQLELIQNENDAAIAEGGTYDLTRVAYWGPNTGNINTAVSQALERVFLGDQDVATAFAQADEEVQGLLEQ